jgi:hypothetical protein
LYDTQVAERIDDFIYEQEGAEKTTALGLHSEQVRRPQLLPLMGADDFSGILHRTSAMRASANCAHGVERVVFAIT